MVIASLGLLEVLLDANFTRIGPHDARTENAPVWSGNLQVSLFRHSSFWQLLHGSFTQRRPFSDEFTWLLLGF